MGEKAKIKEGYQKYLKTLLLSTAIAFIMLYIALGLMLFAKEGNPIPTPFILLIAAIFFVIFSVFYQSKGKSKGEEGVKSLIKGLFLAICTTFAFAAVFGGLKFMVDPEFEVLGGIGTLISALAICLIVSMVFLSLLKPS